jgi:predicted MFS family arabinose efflux permease
MKLVIMRSLCLESIAYVGAALSGNLEAFVVARLLVGLAFGNNAVIVAVISLVTPERRLGTAVGLYTTIFPIGLSVGPLLGSLLISLFGLRWMYAIDAASCVTAAIVLGLCMREPSRAGRPRPAGWREHLTSVFGTVIRNPAVRWNFALWFLISGGIALLDPYIPVLVSSVYRGPALAATIGIVLAVFGLASGVSTPFTPRLADRLGAARALALAAGGLAVVALALPMATTVPVIAALLLLRAAPQAATVTTLFTHLARHTPAEHRAGVLALSPLPRNLAMFLAPLAGSALSSTSLGAVFVLAGLLFLISIAATVPLHRADVRAPLSLANPGSIPT